MAVSVVWATLPAIMLMLSMAVAGSTTDVMVTLPVSGSTHSLWDTPWIVAVTSVSVQTQPCSHPARTPHVSVTFSSPSVWEGQTTTDVLVTSTEKSAIAPEEEGGRKSGSGSGEWRRQRNKHGNSLDGVNVDRANKEGSMSEYSY